MRLNMKKIYIALALVFAMFIGSIGGLVWAENSVNGTDTVKERWQTVYVISKKTGIPYKVVVVDMLKGSGKNLSISIPVKKPIVSIKPFSEDVETVYNDGKIILNTDKADTVYYRADVQYSKDLLPFSYGLQWYLNGEEVDPSKIIGRTGTVKLVFSLRSNYKIDGTYVPFLGMLNVSIDTQHASDIKTDSMPPMVVGSNYQVNGIVMALDEEKSTYVIWHTTDFTYPDIKIVVMPHMMDVSLPDMAGPMSELADNLQKLSKLPSAHEEIVKNMYKSIDPGKVDQLAKGLLQMRDGVAKIVDQLDKSLKEPENMDMSKLDDMEKALRNIATALDGYHQIISSLSDGHLKLIDGAKALHEGVINLKEGLDKTHEGVVKLRQASLQIEEGSSKLVQAATTAYDVSLRLKNASHQLYGALGKLDMGLTSIVGALVKEEGGLTFMANGTTGVPSLGELANKVASVDGDMAKALMMYQKVASDTLKAHIQVVDGLKTWKTSFVSVVNGMKDLYQGIDKLSSGLGNLNNGMVGLNTGVSQLSMGLSQLEKGTASLSIGASALADGAENLIQGLEKEYKVMEILKDGGEIKEGVNIPSLLQLSSALNQIADGVMTLKNTLKTKSEQANEMVSSLQKLKEALQKVEKGLDGAYKGTLQLEKGMKSIKKVLGVLAYGGTLEGKDVPSIGKTSEILNEMAGKLREKVDELNKGKEDIQRYKEVAQKYRAFIGDIKDVPSHVVFVIVPK